MEDTRIPAKRRLIPSGASLNAFHVAMCQMAPTTVATDAETASTSSRSISDTASDCRTPTGASTSKTLFTIAVAARSAMNRHSLMFLGTVLKRELLDKFTFDRQLQSTVFVRSARPFAIARHCLASRAPRRQLSRAIVESFRVGSPGRSLRESIPTCFCDSRY